MGREPRVALGMIHGRFQPFHTGHLEYLVAAAGRCRRLAVGITNPEGFPVYAAGRGGRYTYHGPGQRVGYVLLDLDRRGRDVRRFVHALEGWVIGALAALGVEARRAPGRIGIWVDGPGGEAKIGALGLRIRRWVTMHGFAINLDPKLSHFSGIVPCGIADFPVTSLGEMGLADVQPRFDLALRGGLDDFLFSLEGGMGECGTGKA